MTGLNRRHARGHRRCPFPANRSGPRKAWTSLKTKWAAPSIFIPTSVAVAFDIGKPCRRGRKRRPPGPQYNVLYRNVNMVRSFVDAAEAKKIMASVDML